MRAQDSLRLEKGYGIWSFEFSASNTPAQSGLDRFVAFDKGDFVGRDAVLAERETGPSERLVLLEVDSPTADCTGYEPIHCDGERVGYVTSGAYGHHVKASLALGYVRRDIAEHPRPLSVDVIGDPRPARILAETPYDPLGRKLRG
jgi:dimethylglycine dehydrogenase